MLIIAFAIGVLRLPSRGRALRATGWLLFAFAMTGALWAVSPMHERGAAMGWQDVGHIALSVVSVLLILSYIGIGGFALGNGFLLYSMATLLAFLVSASLTFALAPALARDDLQLPALDRRVRGRAACEIAAAGRATARHLTCG
jgi:hypothetical protein